MKIATINYTDPNAPQQLVKSLKETGFAVIKNHPISSDLIKEVYQEWEKFFASQEKHKYTFDPKNQTGYFPFKSENAKDSQIKDLKEFFHVYKESNIPSQVSIKSWELRNKLNEIGADLLQWVQDNLPPEISAKFSEPLPDMVKGSEDTLFRVLHYPPLPDDAEKGAVRAYAHGDVNLLTCLLTAAGPNGDYVVGAKTGLEVKDVNGNWYEVESDPNCLIINCGDFLEAATEGYLISTIHQVKNPLGEAAKVSRYSCPLFIHPRGEVILSGTKTARQFLDERLKEIGLKK
jgi:isopenicillin N synthase-like dioxygenase